MIGVDTNVLVRVFVPDSPAETTAALAFLGRRSSDDPAFVSMLVLVELGWVLKRSYGFAASAIHVAFESLFDSANILVEQVDVVQTALAQSKQDGSDFADCLIAALATVAGCEATVTFDRHAARDVPGMELLS